MNPLDNTLSNQPVTTAIIQARMGATRLPNKVLLPIVGYPILWHVVTRAKRAKTVNQVVIATSTNPENDSIEAFCQENQFTYYRGSENDVLDRFYQAAKQYEADIVIRITADCPLTDPAIIDQTVNQLLDEQADYATNTFTYTYPEGMDVEVFTFHSLETAWKNASSQREREHVTPYIRNHNGFKHVSVENPNPNPVQNCLSIDRENDYQLVKTIFEKLYVQNPYFGVDEVVKLMVSEPALQSINQSNTMNEGAYLSYTKEPPVEPKQMNLSRSRELLNQAANLIPSKTQTFSKGYTQFIQSSSPNYAQKAHGAVFWDVDGNEFLEYTMSLGPILLGHSYPTVIEAVQKSLLDGTIFSLPHELEIEVSQMIVDAVPSAEMVRFGKNGSDVTSAAVRVARAFTGRDMIACCGYHGWQDWYIGTTTRKLGVPQAVYDLTKTFEYNRIESLEALFHQYPNQIAAVIMEPIGIVEPENNFLQQVKELTHQHGALLVFDEVITGFRMSIGGAQSYFNVIPDLTCCGKAMGNGFPVSAIAGRADVMRKFDDIFFSFTFGGETLSLAAAKAVMQTLIQEPVHAHIWALGKKLRDGLNTLANYYQLSNIVYCKGLPPRCSVMFQEKDSHIPILKSLFQQECMKRGLFFTGTHFICYSHTQAQIDFTLRVYRTVLEILAEAVASNHPETWLEAAPTQPVFRRP